MNKEIVCIGCPMGCRLSVIMEENNVIKVMGNNCNKGVDYARNECTNPIRMVTTTVIIDKAMYPLISVRTSKPVPKDMVRKCVEYMRNMRVEAPVSAGQVLVKDILGTGADIIATKTLNAMGDRKHGDCSIASI